MQEITMKELADKYEKTKTYYVDNKIRKALTSKASARQRSEAIEDKQRVAKEFDYE